MKSLVSEQDFLRFSVAFTLGIVSHKPCRVDWLYSRRSIPELIYFDRIGKYMHDFCGYSFYSNP